MTYGWAILVVMIVGIVMWQLGIFSMGTTTLTATGFGKIKPQLAATKLTAGGTFIGTFTNGAGTTITVDSVNVTDTQKSSNNNCINSTDTSVGAGDNFQSTCVMGSYVGKAGDVYTANVVIGYNVTIGGLTSEHKDTGTIRGPLESA
ncbi:Uncharacterised protein [uncultured archaeon]|nr:Uncharacterised protein [uncultured archaeon]